MDNPRVRGVKQGEGVIEVDAIRGGTRVGRVECANEREREIEKNDWERRDCFLESDAKLAT